MPTSEELKLLLDAPMRRRNALAIRILLATAVRSAELYSVKWAVVDLEGAQRHIPKSNTGAAMDIPLVSCVVNGSANCRRWPPARPTCCRRIHVAARPDRGDTHLNKDTLRETIDRWLRTAKPAVRRFTPHDLRSTVKSHLRSLGLPRNISEMWLNHQRPGANGIYDRNPYLGESREASGKWAELLARTA